MKPGLELSLRHKITLLAGSVAVAVAFSICSLNYLHISKTGLYQIWQENLALAGAPVLLSLVVAAWVAHRLTKPLQQMTDTVLQAKTAEGLQNLPVQLKGEIGDLARAFQQMADNLMESEVRVRSIMDNAVDGIITIDEHGNVETFNKACETIFGYTMQEVVGKNVKMLMPEPYHTEHDGYLQNYNTTGHKKIIGIGREVEGKRKDGSTFPLDLGVSDVRVQGKRTFMGIIRDITERKEAEAKQQQFVEEISASNEDLERFAYICSHDLQEPLRMVRSYTQKMEMYFKDKELDEKVLKYMHYIIDGAARAQGLIHDILAYSRMDFDHKQEDIDLNKVLEFAVGNLEVLIEERKATVTAGPLPVISGNRMLMIQLFQNFINNAIKYSIDKPKITINVEDSGEQWRIAVNDNGIGISPEYHRKIFIIFERLHKKNEYGGSGIGLAICKKIVERHHGTIWVESEEGKGATFYFTLPKHVANG